ncbi:LPS-assembly protein LptD [Microbaculum marinum]|uniref:LPS-assembly protein LptD n=1 Tax=Microbaculum marinum TaxID=1764581 RepID=A0AAW9S161_9HYPH
MPGIGVATLAAITGLAVAFLPAPALAQMPTSSAFDQIVSDDPDARMVLEADELIYDFDRNVVSAEGAVDIYYKGYTIESDRVEYDQNTGKVFARGHVKITQPDGNVIYAETTELTDDFRDGFVQELTLVTTDETRFAAASAERFDDNVTVFNSGVYTACEPCEEQPEKPPVWQIKAKRIIHNQEEQTVYYEDASFEFFGMPIAYLPFFSHPDPTVKQQSGFLRPSFVYDADLGYAADIPYYFALAPDYDLTVSVTTYTLQGPLGSFEWRQRFERGGYYVRGAGIYQLDPGQFPITSDNHQDFRGAVQSAGEFQINDFWKWGWTGTLQSDDIFLRTYDLTDANEVRDQLYLTGQSARNWFDARTIHYQVFKESRTNNDGVQPFVHPVVDYNYIFGESILGGRLSFDANVLSLTRDDPEFLPLYPFASKKIPNPDKPGKNMLNPLFCPFRAANVLAKGPNSNTLDLLSPQACDLIGTPGTSNRLISEIRWDRTITDSIGQVFTPFASVRGDLYSISVDDPLFDDGLSSKPIIDQFLPGDTNNIVRGMAALGVEYRYPILISDDWGYQIIEPIAQVVARPDAQDNYEIPNNDALSLVFDDTNLFDLDKFSGYDLMEGGTRANVGVRYSMQTTSGIQVGGLFGQSYQLAGNNPFPLGSGLETDRSDYVAALYFSPISSLQIVNRIRLDEDDFDPRRYDFEVSGGYGPVRTAVIYSNIAADPQQGIDENREEIQGQAKLRLDENWSVWGGGRYELSGVSKNTFAQAESPQWISNSFGFGYENECISIGIAYERQYQRDQDTLPDERIMFKFSLRTLTEGTFRQSISEGDTN